MKYESALLTSSKMFCVLALVLWGLSLSANSFNPDIENMLKSPMLLFISALGSLCLGSALLWKMRTASTKLLWFYTFIMLAMLWLSPVIMQSSPVSAQWTYGIYYPNTQFISQTGGIDPSEYTFHNWPGFFVLDYSLSAVTGASCLDFLAFYGPFLMQILILIPLYCLFKNIIPNPNHRFAAIWVFYLANWVAQIYFVPQGVGVFFLICLLALITSPGFTASRGNAVSHRVVIILMLAALTVTHLLSSVVALLCLGALILSRLIKGFNLGVLAGVLVGCWTIYGAATQFDSQLPEFVNRAFELENLLRFSSSGGGEDAGAAFLEISRVRFIFSGLFAGLAVLGVLLSLKYRHRFDFSLLALEGVAMVILCSMLYGSEFWTRAFLFSLVPIAYFAAKLLRNRLTTLVMVAALLVAIPGHLLAHYGAVSDMVSRFDVAAWQYLENYTLRGYVSGGISYIKPDYLNLSLKKLDWQDGLLVSQGYTGRYPQYLQMGRSTDVDWVYYNGDNRYVSALEAELEGSAKYGLIYQNGEMSIYFNQGAN
ncbi:hypothetical protein ABFB50_04820 [Dehalococcoides sp. THU3]|uniref:hypothetical protein n=1 Tax=Dehalococcoides TaxID=61434 RepID=UPI0005B566A0|nr:MULTISPECIES: hypothetical protein [Dehalococcoides]QYY58499.1 hypothetical protein CWV2_000413 [Dehalococcoides mccartyi]BAQ34197.1 hypothetical protein UCH007_02390 [Dehalococcoides sp. UCH007]